MTPVPCPRPAPATGHRVLGHQLPPGRELLLGAEPRPPAGHRLRGHLQVSGGPQSLSPCPPALGSCPCVPRHGTDTGECTLTGPRSCSFGDLQVFSLTPYELNVTARNPLGAASGALSFLLENISECCGMGDTGVPCGTLVSHPLGLCPARDVGSSLQRLAGAQTVPARLTGDTRALSPTIPCWIPQPRCTPLVRK